MGIPVTLSYIDGEGRSHLAPGASAARPGALDIIDQTLLPGEQKRLSLTTPEAVFEAIKQLRGRGAPAIGCSAAIGLAVCARRFASSSPGEHLERIKACAAYLDSSHPTAVELAAGSDRDIYEREAKRIEEIQQGIPAIGYKLDGTPEVVIDGETGYVTAPQDIEAVAARSRELLADPELRRRMGKKGRELVLERFDWRRMADILEKEYYRLLQEKISKYDQVFFKKREENV